MSTKLENARSTQKIHAISSSVRQKGKSITGFPSKKAEKLDLDRYLVGRSYQLFKGGIKNDKTLELYRRNLYYFCDFVKKPTEQIADQHGPYKKVNGRNRPDIEGIQELQKLVENYVLRLQERVGLKEIKASSCVARIPAVKPFCEMNDIVLNWLKIGKLLPSTDLVGDDEAYTREQIKKILQFCDLRTRIIVLFLASSGMRLGGLSRFEGDRFARLKHGHLQPICSDDKDDPRRVIAVHVRVYAGTKDEYDTFLTPEAWQAYSEYLQFRVKCGEKITSESPILLGRFSKKTLAEGKAKPIDPSTVQNLLAAVRFKAGLNDRLSIRRSS
ncbi:MAG TPA: hypothetical protein VF172_00360 [Nitrososphaera sp.]